MKKQILTIAIMISSLSVMAQTKPRQVTVKKATYVDSTYYLPDTLAVIFKELIIKKDTIYEKWQHGYVIWQTWQERGSSLWSGNGSIALIGTSTYIYSNQIEWKFPYTVGMQGGFMYSDRKTHVKNKVLLALKP